MQAGRGLLSSMHIAMGVALLALAGCQQSERIPVAGSTAHATAWAGITEMQTTDIIVGTGAEAVPDSRVEVHYDGWLYDPATPDHHGEKFDSSRERDRPFRFRIGAGTVIRGWDQGVAGMKVGGRRQLVIPAALGYGERGAGGGVIPPGAALVFDIELLKVEL